MLPEVYSTRTTFLSLSLSLSFDVSSSLSSIQTSLLWLLGGLKERGRAAAAAVAAAAAAAAADPGGWIQSLTFFSPLESSMLRKKEAP